MIAAAREQELEDEIEILKQQLSAVTGSPRELGALMALRRGMTHRLAKMLFLLVNRAPAVITRQTFHSVFYGSQDDGGPEPKIFNVHISRLRDLLARLECPGKIDTVWHEGYRASPELVDWVQAVYSNKVRREK